LIYKKKDLRGNFFYTFGLQEYKFHEANPEEKTGYHTRENVV
jgi:hypothetical protein